MRSLLVLLALPGSALAATLDVGPGQTYGTIQSAVDAAEDGDLLAIQAGTYDEEITIDDKDLTLSALGAVTVVGSNASLLAIFDSDVEVLGLDFQPSGGRGVRASDSTVLLSSVTISGNDTGDAPYNGAAVAVYDGSEVTVVDSTFTNNRTYANFFSNISSGWGGHIVVVDGDLVVENTTFDDGEADEGGAIHARGTGSVTILDSTFTGLAATERGGALFLTGAVSALVEGSTFSGNDGDALGGAIRWEDAPPGTTLTLRDTTFTNNSADDYGGAIATNTDGDLVIEDAVFTGNTADQGGAMSIFRTDSVTVRRSFYCNNSADAEGAAMRLNEVGLVDIASTALSSHAVSSGGGGTLWTLSSPTVSLANVSIVGSTAAGGGAAVRAQGADLTAVNTLFTQTAGGPALSAPNGTLTLDHNAWFDNPGGDVATGTIGPNAVTTDPALFAYVPDGLCGNDDLRPSPASPLIDAGDPSILDPDGSVSDIGAFAGEHADDAWFEDDDGDGFAWVQDCDDASDLVFPGAAESCNGVDNDCDGVIDSPVPGNAGTWYPDGDGDGAGVTADGVQACEAPAGFVAVGGDCADDDADVNPSATEVCDGIDNDCSGNADGGDAVDQLTWYLDDDGDGFGLEGSSTTACEQPDGYALAIGDCDDALDTVNPGADEICDDLDNDCDGTVDGDDAIDQLTWYADGDGDGFGSEASGTIEACDRPAGYGRADDDCDDADGTVYPGAPETCDPPLVDTNCDGLVGDADNDGDGFIACEDCDDTNPDAYPGAPEIWYDGIILDCDSLSDFDADGDGFESDDFGGTDCDDADPSINPDADERFGDDIDSDCDGDIGEDAFLDEPIVASCSGCAAGGSGRPGLAWPVLGVVIGLGLRRRERALERAG